MDRSPLEVAGERRREKVGALLAGNLKPLALINAHHVCHSLNTVLPYEKVYLDSLPSAEMYEKSYMHRDVITMITHMVCTKSVSAVYLYLLEVTKQPSTLE